MGDGDEEHSPDGTPEDDELAGKLARLNEDQKTRYDVRLQNFIDRNAEAGRDYRLKLADTLLKQLRAGEEAREIGGHDRREQQRLWWRDQARDGQSRSGQAPPPAQEAQDKPDGPTPSAAPQAKPGDALEGRLPKGPPRDYSALQRLHERTPPKAGERPSVTPEPGKSSPETAAPLLSRERLTIMIEHFPDIRREAGLLIGQSEIRERAELALKQNAERTNLEQAHGAQPVGRQHEESNLLDHQHLAEQAGLQAKWIAKQLSAKGSPDADRYDADARSAMGTARIVQQQRQHPGARDSSRDTERIVRADQQNAAKAQEAARGEKHLTSEQRANLPPDARQAIDRQERVKAAREIMGRAEGKILKQGQAKSGPTRPGGRSR
jgi:hypothetical protein